MDNGGPAFPIPGILGQPVVEGMSLRDWFAGMALQAIDVQAHVSAPAASHIARSAYVIADAMLAEREKAHE